LVSELLLECHQRKMMRLVDLKALEPALKGFQRKRKVHWFSRNLQQKFWSQTGILHLERSFLARSQYLLSELQQSD
jgi:hypothetical protein